MDFFSALIYGIIQGITEFLPISSSGHLALLPRFLSIEDPGIIFDISMHMGTALAIIVYFYKEIGVLIRELISILSLRSKGSKSPFVLNMIISTVATFVLVLIIKKWALGYGRNLWLIAGNLVLFGVLMFVADNTNKDKQVPERIKMMKKINIKEAIWIGLFQSFAIFPGVSRSGATLTISRFMGLTRKEASRYSFLLSLPVIFAAFIFKFSDFFQQGKSFNVEMCLIGGVISFIVGIATIHFFLKVIDKVGLGVFAFYRVLLGLVLFYLFHIS